MLHAVKSKTKRSPFEEQIDLTESAMIYGTARSAASARDKRTPSHTLSTPGKTAFHLKKYRPAIMNSLSLATTFQGGGKIDGGAGQMKLWSRPCGLENAAIVGFDSRPVSGISLTMLLERPTPEWHNMPSTSACLFLSVVCRVLVFCFV